MLRGQRDVEHHLVAGLLDALAHRALDDVLGALHLALRQRPVVVLGPVHHAHLDAGGTDILITFVYKIAFSTGHGRDYGLASAFSVLIFLFVGTISYLSFRRTRTLEDIA